MERIKLNPEDDQKTLQKHILKIIRDKELFTKDLKEYVESHICDNLGLCCRKNKSINEWKPDSSFIDENGKGLNQKTVFISARTFDLWEEGLIEVLDKKLRDVFSNVRVFPSYCTTHDIEIVIVDENDEIVWKMEWEVKTTLGSADSFTGVTHGKGKCDNYFLIKTEIDKELKLSAGINNAIIKSMFVIVWDNMEADWVGEPTDTSSFTSLKIDGEKFENKKEILVVGKIINKSKNGNKFLAASKFELEKL